MVVVAVPDVSVEVAYTDPFTTNATVPVGFVPVTAAVAVNEDPYATDEGTPESAVDVLAKVVGDRELAGSKS